MGLLIVILLITCSGFYHWPKSVGHGFSLIRIMESPKITLIALLATLFLFFTATKSRADDLLDRCWQKQGVPVLSHTIELEYSEVHHRYEHSFQPWQESEYKLTGKVWRTNALWHKVDTFRRGNRTFVTHEMQDPNGLQIMQEKPGGQNKLTNATQTVSNRNNYKSAYYNPILLLQHFRDNNVKGKDEGDFTSYLDTITGYPVRLYIRKENALIDQISIIEYDDLFGNVETRIWYETYASKNLFHYPEYIRIDKVNGKLHDQVNVTSCNFIDKMPAVQKPDTSVNMKEDDTTVNISVEQYSDHIHFINLHHTDDKVLLVEFDDFLFIAEAPLNSKNGELIIKQAQQIAPEKPIKYFAFGHYHPHYTGGMRPFIHKGATILCRESDLDYVQYLANANHSLNPDSLYFNYKPLKTEIVGDQMTISDDSYECVIHFIGKKSKHTNDYLVYYFPEEKMLFEDDLVWIKKDQPISKAGSRQKGLYDAIQDIGIDVETVVQSWPIDSYGVKTTIPFDDLKKSVELTE